MAEMKDDSLSAGDLIMAVVAFLLTPIVSIALAVYNFAKSRKPQGMLYLGVLAVQVVLGVAVTV